MSKFNISNSNEAKTKGHEVLYVIAELHQEQHYVKDHIQKTCAFFKSMESFAQALQKTGHHVLYLTFDEMKAQKFITSTLPNIG